MVQLACGSFLDYKSRPTAGSSLCLFIVLSCMQHQYCFGGGLRSVLHRKKKRKKKIARRQGPVHTRWRRVILVDLGIKTGLGTITVDPSIKAIHRVT
ncbi:hypothetical protein BO94DRAFT_84882 [Aspergillus sclerotioniger CBS 115572]|uniref:Uncharacterized protein n=1 Tax=Aspergillus sclerotioniger CBS 115572 TaxID=1450535 RepID=A0A317WJK9_9EURO|nr:hypothetical protein BO94DRAFT_84882 [Aspergillus sclerotioniger CBS 115572]PWY86509.1 hypothetical protein BO94DRAFT_84882 [Aspergillus sclerotioniger CBS 115572]